MNKRLTKKEVLDLATGLHHGQVDKGGIPYINHVKSVGDALSPFGTDVVFAGYLHDTVEDTPATLQSLEEFGLSTYVITAVKEVSRNLYPKGVIYMDMIKFIAVEGSYIARLVKIADNAHNSRTDRVIPNATEESLQFMNKRYATARSILYSSVESDDIETILKNINPDLLVAINKM